MTLAKMRSERGGRCEASVGGLVLPRRSFLGGCPVTPEAASLAAEVPEDWFARAQRAFADLQLRFERRQRELGVREEEFEMRSRDLAARAEQLREAFRSAEDTSQALMDRTHGLRGEGTKIATEGDALYRERQGGGAPRQGRGPR